MRGSHDLGINGLTLVQEIRRVQTLVATCDCRTRVERVSSLGLELRISDESVNNIGTHNSYAVSHETATETVVLSVNSRVQLIARCEFFCYNLGQLRSKNPIH